MPVFRDAKDAGKITEVIASGGTQYGLPKVMVKWNNGISSPEWASSLVSFEKTVEMQAARVEDDRKAIASMKEEGAGDALSRIVRGLDPVDARVLQQMVER